MTESAARELASPDLARSRDHLLRACLSRLNQGSEDALAEIYDGTSSLIYSITLNMLGNRADAEEVTLDVYLQIWRSASGFQVERGSVIGWLITIARSRAIDRLRIRRSREEREVESFCDRPHMASSPEESTIAGEQQRRARMALAALPANQRRLVELACYGGYSQSELAGKMGLPLGTVKSRIRMGLSRLRELLTAIGEPAR